MISESYLFLRAENQKATTANVGGIDCMDGVYKAKKLR